MIYKIAKRSARSALGDDFAEVWYTFVKSFNRLKAPPQFVGFFQDDLDKARTQAEKEFLSHLSSLSGQLEILQGFVSKKANTEEGKIKSNLLDLNVILSRVRVFLKQIVKPSEEVVKSAKRYGMNQNSGKQNILRVAFKKVKRPLGIHLILARRKIREVASLKNTKR